MQLIQNKSQLSNNKTKHALQILEAGLEAAKPAHFLSKYVTYNKLVGIDVALTQFNKIYIISVGKSADLMTKNVHTKINLDGGIIVIPQTHSNVFSNKKFKIMRASHPIPNKQSVTAAKSIIRFLKNTKKDDLVIFLISGGASSLVCLPYGVTLGQKQVLTQNLLRCGATIYEINALRKHLSLIKGGKILEYLNCTAISYVMSDVAGDDLSTIASGFTYCDMTTYADCMRIITKYGLTNRIPKNILKHIQLGMQGRIPETPKKPKIPNYVVASNKDCIKAMVNQAKTLGYKTKTLFPISGDVKSVANKISKNLPKQKQCLIFGGEPTVKVTGKGKGGRNQELVLQIMKRINPKTIVASVGTDGIDGNTKYAGAISYFAATKAEIENYLKNNDSNSFFKKHGGLIKTGPTHTNLMDIGLALTL